MLRRYWRKKRDGVRFIPLAFFVERLFEKVFAKKASLTFPDFKSLSYWRWAKSNCISAKDKLKSCRVLSPRPPTDNTFCNNCTFLEQFGALPNFTLDDLYSPFLFKRQSFQPPYEKNVALQEKYKSLSVFIIGSFSLFACDHCESTPGADCLSNKNEL